jgi:hypothetical protein
MLLAAWKMKNPPARIPKRLSYYVAKAFVANDFVPDAFCAIMSVEMHSTY